jgi:hypothetical protein
MDRGIKWSSLKRYTKEQLIELKEKFVTQAEIARQLGLTREAVRQIFNRYGIHYSKREQIDLVHRQKKNQIRSLQRKGLTQKEVAAALQIGDAPIRKYGISSAEAALYQRCRRYQEVVKLYESGMKIKDIAAQLKKCVGAVQVILRKHFDDGLRRGEHRRKDLPNNKGPKNVV